MRCSEGCYSPGRIPVTSNVYDIPARLKELNRDFFIMYNGINGKFEVHNSSLGFDTLECVLPFDELDARTISYVRERMNLEAEKLAREIEEYNERLVQKNKEEVVDKANYKMREAFNYLKNNSKTDSIPREVIEE